MHPDDEDVSAWSILAFVVGGSLVAVEAAVLVLAAIGVKDNQGLIYVFSIPFFAHLIGLPVGLIAASIGLGRGDRSRRVAATGLAMMLAGPAFFVLLLLFRFFVLLLLFRSH